MIYLIFILSVNINSLNGNEAKNYSPEERRNLTIEMIRERQYEKALSFAPDQNLLGCVEFLRGDIPNGIEHIKESAEKGNVFSCNLFILLNLKINEKELAKYIEKELEIYPDSTFSFESPYIQYLTLNPKKFEPKNTQTDSIIAPYFLFKSGMYNLDKNPEKTKLYFQKLLSFYPGSSPAIVARNIIRVTDKK
jgi:hypothetical protein